MSTTDPRSEVTGLLVRWRAGDRAALDRLMPLVYDELHAMARGCMQGERRDHTLQATALVHEAFARLVDADVDWQDRIHFLAVSARAMRRILVDHAKARRRHKRGGERVQVSLEHTIQIAAEPPVDLVELDTALERLAEFDERKSRAVELHYFGGLTYDEAAAALEVSPATVKRELKVARAWLRHELGDESRTST